MQDLSGTRIDRYNIQEEIGRGGMSRVYRAHHPGLQRDIALKILLTEITGDDVSVARFMREARAAAQLDHPNIVPIYDTGQDEGSYFIAMRLIEGSTLRELLGERELAIDEISDYLEQVASALDYAHERGIVHRDIKPENIMVDAQGHVTLTDFGIANLADEMSVTTTGAVIGTPVYMAPEQLRGEVATARSDIYALGVLVYELVSGSSPFAGRAPYAVMLAQIDEEPEPVHHRRADLPMTASRAIDRALKKDPALRYATAGAFASQFAGALGGQREVRAAGVAVPGQRLSGTGAVTIRSTVTPKASRVTSAPTHVAAAAAPVSSLPRWRGPRFLGLMGIGLLLVLMFAGISAFRDSQDPVSGEENPALLPVAGTPTPRSTPESAPGNSPETDAVVPVVQPEEDEEPVDVEPPTPTVPVEAVEQPAVEPAPTEVVEQPAVDPAPPVVVEEQPASVPPEDAGDRPDQSQRPEEKPENSGQDDNEEDKQEEKQQEREEKQQEKEDEKQEKNDDKDDD